MTKACLFCFLNNFKENIQSIIILNLLHKFNKGYKQCLKLLKQDLNIKTI